MKALKISAVVLACFLAVLAVLALLALTPAVQTWAARKALAGQTGSTVGRVNAGFSSAEIRNVRLVQDGVVIMAESVTADYSAWDYVTKKKINVDNLVARGVILDLRQTGAVAASGTEAGQASPPSLNTSPNPEKRPPVASSFGGILQQVELPFELRLASLSADGRALLPEEKIATFTLTGQGIAAGQRGTIEWTAKLSDPAPEAAVPAVHSTGELGVLLSNDRRIDLITVDSVVRAEGPQLPRDQIKLEVRAERAATGADENYGVAVSLLDGQRVTPLLKVIGKFSASNGAVTGDWNLAVQPEQFATLLTRLGLPEIAANGSGTFTFNPATSAAAAQGEIQARVSHLEQISPQLGQVGTMHLRAAFDGGFADGIARLEKLQLIATEPDGEQVAEITTSQRVAFEAATQRISLTDPKAELARVGIHALPLAWAQPFLTDLTIASGDISMLLAVAAEPDGSRVHARSAEPLSMRNVTVRRGDQTLVEQLSVTARPSVDYTSAKLIAQLTDLKLSLPAGDALQGTLSATVSDLPHSPVIAFSSSVRAQIVSALKPYLPVDLGPIGFQASWEGRMENDALHVAKLTTSVYRGTNALLFALELQQAVTANLSAQTFSLPRPDAPAARVKFGEIPLEWANAFVPDAQLSGSLAGGMVDVSFAAFDRLGIQTVEPLVLRAVAASLEGSAVVESLDVSMEFSATKQADQITYDVRQIRALRGDVPLASLSANGTANLGEKPSIVTKGNLEADAAALMQQPALSAYATLSRGKISSTFDVSLADAIDANLTLTARDMVAREANQPLGNLEAKLTATVRPDGTGTLIAPVTLINGSRRSDVALNAAFDNSGDALLLTARIASSQLFLDDFRPLAALTPGASNGESKAPTAPTPLPPGTRAPAPASPNMPRDTEPFWAGARGKVEVDLKSVVYGRDYPISGIRGTATIAENRIALEGLEGRLKENPFKANGSITFAAAQPKPYALAALAQVTNFDLGELLRAANPNERPAIESKVTVDARLNGNGGTLGELAKNAYGRFDISGTQGVLRALGNRTELATRGAAALGIVGALAGSQSTSALAEVAAAFAELPFDAFKLQLDRGADLNLKLSNIEFISPLMRTVGNGQVINREGVSPADLPMQVVLQFGAKGPLAQLLNKHGLLGQRTDEQGYFLLERQFQIGGTAAKPDANAFWKQLATELLRTKGLPALQNLLNR